MPFNRGDVVLVLYPDSNLRTAKRRPALEARPELDALIARAMAKRPEERFADAREMRTALARVPDPAARIRG